MKFTLDVNVRLINPEVEVMERESARFFTLLQSTKESLMATLQDLQREVAETAAAVTSLVGVITAQSQALTDLSVQLDAALVNVADPAAFDAIKAGLDAIQAQAAAAVAASA